MFLNELQTIWRSANFTTILSLVSSITNIVLGILLIQNSSLLRRQEQLIKQLKVKLLRQYGYSATESDLK